MNHPTNGTLRSAPASTTDAPIDSRFQATADSAPSPLARAWLLLCLLVLALAAGPAAAQEDGSAANTDESGGAEDVTVQEMTGPIEILVNPVYLPDQAELVYQPLVDYLRAETGLDLRLTTVRNFHRYWLEARRNDAAPLVLEDAHMAAFRRNNFGYVPLVTTSRPVSFSLLASNASMEPTLAEFVGKRVSTLPSPSLGFLILTDWYENPLQQPVVLSNATSWLDAVEIVFSMEADAAIVPQSIAEKYPNLITIATSEEIPGLTLSAAPSVPESVRDAVTQAMISLHENSDYHAALFELDVDQFVEADPADYRDLDAWLDNIFSL
ncbi:PhnD/SsuA/transferrin family substrate-binding protein [Halomonas denitrificans]|nr:phosphate/phosphite/phosphonate ABC transporter substrate-binding protein [Halomonas denitrificans]